MKKITLLLFTILPLLGFAQTFDFSNTDDGWNVLGGLTSANGVTFMTLTTVDGDGAKKNPAVATTAAGVDTSVNSVVGITLRNNDATGPDYLRVSYLKPTGGRFYSNLDITTGDSGFVTYWFDLSNATHWVGTMNDIKLHFKSAGNSDYILPNNPNNISIDIDKIEFAASIPTTLQESYVFGTNGDTEGFTATNGSISGPTGGILTFTPTATKFAKLEQGQHHVDASANKQVHIRLKNNSAANDQLRFIFPKAGGGNSTTTMTMSTSDGSVQNYRFDMSGNADWTGDVAFTIGIGSLLDGKAQDAGTVEFSSVLIDNILGVDDYKKASFSLYPNPAKDILNINSIEDISKVAIFDITGKKVMEDIELNNNQLNVSKLNTGLYLIKLTNSNNLSAIRKLIIK